MSRLRRVLVTGGAGFIGSNIIAKLREEGGFEIAVCDRLRKAAEGKWRNLAQHSIDDFFTPDTLFDWLGANGAALDVVIHMGAISSTMEEDADLIVQTNFALSRDLYRWCAEYDTRLIYASSAATYGDGDLGFHGRDDLASLTALRPLNPYGWSKALFDVFTRRQAQAGAAPPQCAGLKFFNVYGPNEYHKGPMKSVAAKIWPLAREGRTVRLFKSHNKTYADGGQLRDFVYVKDAADIVAWLVDHPDV
ncbi:MAG: ADP-glyceromanno-heptose 6-epimerase, partial [Caulobacteraceae bacterium]|nr:ADP-glyceromanno-heptose 6-epimerase [Caulobacteraceae bacterium]